MGSSPPMTDNSVFHCIGHVCKTSKADIGHGAWARSSTMEYCYVALTLGL